MNAGEAGRENSPRFFRVWGVHERERVVQYLLQGTTKGPEMRTLTIAEAQDLSDTLTREAHACSDQGYHRDASELEVARDHLDRLVSDAEAYGEDVHLATDSDLEALADAYVA